MRLNVGFAMSVAKTFIVSFVNSVAFNNGNDG